VIVLKIKERRIMTKEERKELSDRILIALLDGDEESEIMIRCDCTLGNVKIITGELIKSGSIKKEDIIEAREKKRRKDRRTGIPLSQEYRAECKEKILERVRAKDINSFAKCARELGISAPTVRKLINELIAEGEIREVDVSNAVQDRSSKVKISDKYSENEKAEHSNNSDLAEQGKDSNKETIPESEEQDINYNNIISQSRNRIREMILYNIEFSVEEVSAYVTAIKELFSRNHGNLKTDMNILRRVIPMHEELMTKGNVNLVIRYFTRKKQPEICLSFIDECIESMPQESVDLMR